MLDNVVEWKTALLCLGVERCQPLLHAAGLPRQMASFPGTLQSVTMRTLLAAEDLAAAVKNPPPDQAVALRAELLTEPYAAGMERLLARATAEMAAEYGDEATEGLIAWIERHFLNPQQRHRWWLWSILLPRLADAYGTGGPVTPAAIDRGPSEVFSQIVREWFTPALDALDAGQIARARAMPLSPLEQRLLALEVIEPDDPGEIDVVGAIEDAIREERAWRAWNALAPIVSAAQRRQLVDWAAREAAAMQVPLDLVRQLILPLGDAP